MDTLARVLTDGAPQLLQKAVETSEGETQKDKDKTPPSGNRTKLLVAEDNMVNQMVLTKFIDEDVYEVLIAENGEKAFEIFRKHAPAAVLMDLSMPVMDGFQATAKIREYEKSNDLKRTPIIATTAHVLDEDRERCRRAGMDDFLAKPMKKSGS